MNKEIELLAPGGDIDSIKAAILAGANAVYCGLDKFNARNRAENIRFKDLPGILRLAHKNNCEIFITLNIIIVESEIPALISLLNKLVKTQVDGIIIQDLGLFYLLSKYFPSFKLHASTQLTTHNEAQIKFLSKLSATRVNLSRELNIDEIRSLALVGHEHNVLSEVFVHGSNCISFSGLCYMSSVNGGNSGNRGRCSQPCRDQYLTTAADKNFPLNIKDNSAFSDLKALSDAGVDSIKIEGRIKKYHYVFTVVETWRKQLQNFYQKNKINNDNSELRKVFNRDFSNSFLQGNISKSVFIDNPRDNSAIYFSEQLSKNPVESTENCLSQAKKNLFNLKVEITTNVKDRIKKLRIEPLPLVISLSGEADQVLQVSIKIPDSSFTVVSVSNLMVVDIEKSRSQSLTCDLLLKRFKAINDTVYFIEEINFENLTDDLFIPFKELTLIKNEILFILNGSTQLIEAVNVPALKKRNNEKITPSLSLLISSEKNLYLCNETLANVYFQLPNSFKGRLSYFLEIFRANKQLIPWFPSILIGDDFNVAVDFIYKLKPERIVTNNTGIAYVAYQKEISWIAGPYMNLVNSYSLLCLKENFDCMGAFISNELNETQIKGIKKPADFKLYYSIYHPIVLMTSRACMFHQVTGCKKNIVDDKCIQRCKKSSSITNLKKISYFIDKSKGDYHSVYNETNFLNTDIVTDAAGTFDSFFVDLRDVNTGTKIERSKLEVVTIFENLLKHKFSSVDELQKTIHPSTNTQYRKGI